MLAFGGTEASMTLVVRDDDHGRNLVHVAGRVGRDDVDGVLAAVEVIPGSTCLEGDVERIGSVEQGHWAAQIWPPDSLSSTLYWTELMTFGPGSLIVPDTCTGTIGHWGARGSAGLPIR